MKFAFLPLGDRSRSICMWTCFAPTGGTVASSRAEQSGTRSAFSLARTPTPVTAHRASITALAAAFCRGEASHCLDSPHLGRYRPGAAPPPPYATSPPRRLGASSCRSPRALPLGARVGRRAAVGRRVLAARPATEAQNQLGSRPLFFLLSSSSRSTSLFPHCSHA